jgi:tetratricopeptide (TPR) repeat protein
MLHEQLGKMQQAIKGYTTFLEVSESPLPHIQEHLLRLMFKQKMAEAQGQQTSINLSCFEQALLLFKQKKYRKALEIIDSCLLKEPRDNDGKILKAQILNAMQQTEQALNQVCNWITSDPHNGLWLELRHLNLALYLADLYARTQQVDLSIAQHKRAYQLTSDTAMRAKLLAHLAILYYDYDMIDQMEYLAKQAETLPHNFAPLHNVVAYWHATQGNNIVRAQTLINNALSQEPLNPFYIDTQAMIFFKQEQYAQAEKLFEKSAQLIPDEPMILEHLAQCYIKQNKPALALSTLKKGLVYTQNKTKETFNRLIRSIETSIV